MRDRTSARRHDGRYARDGRTALIALTLALALTLATPLSALADTQSSDVIGKTSIADRGGSVVDAPDVDATASILETSDGTVLWSRNADAEVPMASTTKIMTCLLAVENLDLSSTVTIADEATTVGESSCYLTAGATCNAGDLVTAMMLKSGNDAATAVAIATAGSVDAFVQMMNDKATELGMTHTHFLNPHGLMTDSGSNYTSASDYAILARYAMENETFRNIVGTTHFDGDLGSGEVVFDNTNQCLYSLPGCIGIKTGTEDDAGYCVVTCTERAEGDLYCVIFGSSTDGSRFDSAAALTEWGYRHYHTITLDSPDTVVASIQDIDWLDVTVPVVAKDSTTVKVLDYDGDLVPTVDLEKASGTIREGDKLGEISWTQGATTLATSDLVSTKSVSIPGPVDMLNLWYLRNVHHATPIYPTTVYATALDPTSPYVGSADQMVSLGGGVSDAAA